MDVDVLASIDANKCHGLCTYTLKSTNSGIGDLSTNELCNDETEYPNIEEDNDSAISFVPPCRNNDFQKKNKAIDTCFNSCQTSSSSTIQCTEIAVDADATENKDFTPHDNIKPLPLVSAMKGSREKRGITPPQKLTVKWDPDVYDPIPSSVSHVVTKNKPQKQSKKNSRSKQKTGSKSSHRNRSKNKFSGKGGGG
ncbi:uncharacterized protein [Rutidosis leptorrhynchoides]|uniref:uncharacterized protein n=1 Tax=Rutidosis leptorrhynchoides TaxID=125765 RepID=UPI003A992955